MSAGHPSGRGRSRLHRRRSLRLGAASWWLPMVLATSGCAGTPWGETLSGSFPPARDLGSPPSLPAVTRPAPVAPPPERQPSPAPAGTRPPSPPQPPPRPQPPAAKAPPRPAASLPSPYRVTLRLPRADPSAPAEAVTQALRAAGIPFEVETIEQVKGGAPAPAAVRPAPPPR